MHSPAELLRELQDAGVDLFCGVPDSLLRPFCDLLTPLPPDRHVITANEGAAVALAMGHYLGGGLPLVYLQNSGLGNAVNPLLSLADPLVYGIPLLLLVGWRGEPGVPDEPQHAKQGAVTPALLDAMDIPCRVLDGASSGPRQLVREAVDSALGRGGPHALLVRKGALGPSASAARPADAAWSREAALAQVLERLHGDDLVVATTGFTGRELYEQRRARGEGHARDLLVIGGMGHASQIALGLALRQPGRRVICLDGDGATLMHMGSLALCGSRSPANLYHLVLNNGVHDSVGGQPTAAPHMDLPGVFRACGYRRCVSAADAGQLGDALSAWLTGPGPAALEVRVAAGHRADLGRPTLTPQAQRTAFMGALRGPPEA